MVILAVDSGTTSTRAWVVDAGKVLAGASIRGGAKDVARWQQRFDLLGQVRSVCDGALGDSGRSWDDVRAVVAFGMITSELGLEEVSHLEAPADRRALVDAMRRRVDGALPAPVYLIPGVRSDAPDLAEIDFMRGEETEVVGLLSLGSVDPPILYLSAGSHTKFVGVDLRGRIGWSMTTLSGELLWALHRETILSELVDPTGDLRDVGAVEEGARLAERAGISRALFAARLLNRVHGMGPDTCSAFVHGAVAGTDLLSLRTALRAHSDPPTRVVIAGGSALAQAYRHLLGKEDWVTAIEYMDQPLGALGAWAMFSDASGDGGP
ncbi:MAG: 2-dehydro-3-deoxygalactonokinase [Actinomycetota bacterium]